MLSASRKTHQSPKGAPRSPEGHLLCETRRGHLAQEESGRFRVGAPRAVADAVTTVETYGSPSIPVWATTGSPVSVVATTGSLSGAGKGVDVALLARQRTEWCAG